MVIAVGRPFRYPAAIILGSLVSEVQPRSCVGIGGPSLRLTIYPRSCVAARLRITSLVCRCFFGGRFCCSEVCHRFMLFSLLCLPEELAEPLCALKGTMSAVPNVS